MVNFIQYLHSSELLELSRLSPNAFQRQRVLTFPVLLISLISGFKASVQSELNAFFAHLENTADLTRKVSAQAFSKARKQFSHQAFSRLNQRLLELVTAYRSIPLWHGLRVVAADASKMQLFLQDATGRCVREAIAFALYLPGIEMTLSAELYNPSVGERQMLFEHLQQLSSCDLLVLDRGYPARWLVAHLSQRGIPFCMRVDNIGFKAVQRFLRSGLSQQLVTLSAPSKQDCHDYQCQPVNTQVRLIRVVPPNGRVYVIMTSLLDQSTYPVESFSSLYHSRWRIEEAFKRLKHRLALENTSGLSSLAAQQDFGAKILADNLNALIVLEAADENAIATDYKINRTYAFAHLKRCLPRWLLIALPTAEYWLAMLTELAKNLIKFVSNASKPRPDRPKPHRKHAYKSTA